MARYIILYQILWY